MATRNSSARSSSTPSALAGSRRTSVKAVLSVLNRKCGRMRDCSSARRAVVSAGSVAWARSRSHWKMAAAMAAPASAGPGPASAPRPAADGSGNSAADELRSGIGRQRAERDQRRPLHGHRRAAERPLERADDDQPGQHCRQGHARAGGDEREPVVEASRGEDHADRHHAVHEQQRAQHDADVADVERPTPGRCAGVPALRWRGRRGWRRNRSIGPRPGCCRTRRRWRSSSARPRAALTRR